MQTCLRYVSTVHITASITERRVDHTFGDTLSGTFLGIMQALRISSTFLESTIILTNYPAWSSSEMSHWSGRPGGDWFGCWDKCSLREICGRDIIPYGGFQQSWLLMISNLRWALWCAGWWQELAIPESEPKLKVSSGNNYALAGLS